MRAAMATRSDLEIKLIAAKHKVAWLRGLHQKVLHREMQRRYGQEVPGHMIPDISPDLDGYGASGAERPAKAMKFKHDPTNQSAAVVGREVVIAKASMALDGATAKKAAPVEASGKKAPPGTCQACFNLRRGCKVAGCGHSKTPDCTKRNSKRAGARIGGNAANGEETGDIRRYFADGPANQGKGAGKGQEAEAEDDAIEVADDSLESLFELLSPPAESEPQNESEVSEADADAIEKPLL